MPKKTTKSSTDPALEPVGAQSETISEKPVTPAARKRSAAVTGASGVEKKAVKPARKKPAETTSAKPRAAGRKAKAAVAAAEPHPADIVSEDLVTREMAFLGNTPAVAPRELVSRARNRFEEPPFPTEAERLEIERVAYGYWEQRGYQPGDPFEDWLRAEAEVRARRRVLALA
jgi:Protein of unknown function (DUF2934)